MLLCICLSVVMCLHAASFRPIITNYTPVNYGLSAGLQNWDCTQDAAGVIHVANNRGLLSYDGSTWRLTHVPGTTLVRSVLADGGRIYVGGYGTIGYFEPDAFGQLKYTSLNPLLGSHSIDHEEPWKILKVGKTIYFQTFGSILAYRADKSVLKVIRHPRFGPLYLQQAGGDLWVQFIDGGYCRFDGARFAEVLPRSAVGDDNVVANLLLRPATGSRPRPAMLLATERHGFYTYDGQDAPRKFHTEIDRQLCTQTINRVALLRGNTVVVGTISGGVYAIDLTGRLLWHYSMPDGLVNNTVMRLFCDATDNVWACLDGGIAVIHSGLPITFFKSAPWEQPIGMVYDMRIIDRQLLMATNQGFYTFPMEQREATPHLLDGSQGQNWHVTAFDRQVFVGGNQSTYAYDSGRLTPLPDINSASTSMLRCQMGGEEVLIESSYSDLRVYRRDGGGKWRFSHNIGGFISPVRNLVIDGNGHIWAANLTKGFFRLKLSPDLRRVAEQSYFERIDSTAEPSVCYFMKAQGHVVLSDSHRLYRYDDVQRRFVVYSELNTCLPVTEDIHNITECGEGIWVAGKAGFSLIATTGDSLVLRRHLPAEMLGLINNEAAAKVYIDESVSSDGHRSGMAYFNLADGVVRYDFLGRQPKRVVPNLCVAEAAEVKRGGELLPIPLTDLLDGKVSVRAGVSLRVSFPNYDNEGIRFRFLLSGVTKRTVLQTSPSLELSNLNFGRHVLRIEAVDASGRVMDAVQFKFRIATPWYLTSWALLCYLAVIMLGARYYGRWHTRRALQVQRQTYEAERREQHIKVLEQERVIAEQQRQILETELSSQSKELASLAMDVLSKEQVLDNLRATMQEQRQKGGISHRDMSALMQRIRETEGNLEFWSIYQKNFDLIHEHFFRNLKERYPVLTVSDLKFCALLRLNLSTKDIAKFTNISVRGVESARLRLRRKLGLTSDQNLVEFLISIK